MKFAFMLAILQCDNVKKYIKQFFIFILKKMEGDPCFFFNEQKKYFIIIENFLKNTIIFLAYY